MNASRRIPLVDLDHADESSWSAALLPHRRAGQRLDAAFSEQGRAAVGATRVVGGEAGAKALHAILDSPRGAELRAIAEGLALEPGKLVLTNTAYDLAHVGC